MQGMREAYRWDGIYIFFCDLELTLVCAFISDSTGNLAGGIAASFFAPFGLTVMFVLLFFTDSGYEFLILFFQGCELVKIVVSGSIFSTLILILSNLLCLLVLKLGLYGYLISQMAAYFLASSLMLILAKKLGVTTQGMDENGTFGDGTKIAVNQALKKGGYDQNGIAGTNFIKYLAKLIKSKT